MGEFTQLLGQLRQGRSEAADELARLVYGELRRVAQKQLVRANVHGQLDASGLVNETYARLLGRDDQWVNRKHFFFLAARAMRDIVIEEARREQAQKRGGDWQQVALEDLSIRTRTDASALIEMNQALSLLEAEDPLAAQIVQMRFFVGMSYDEVSQALEISVIKARREWAYGKAFLHREICRMRGSS
jgi:RNA polymerase sigma factor (TIGR02999 family)